jgi:hypothetical protein
MLKWSSTARVIAIGLCLLGTPAAAETLPLPQNVIDFTSEQGEHLSSILRLKRPIGRGQPTSSRRRTKHTVVWPPW